MRITRRVHSAASSIGEWLVVRRRTAGILAIALILVLVAVGSSGYVIFTRAPSDPLRPADAIIVLGGEHDGREEYGLQLAEEGYAPVVVLSDPYEPDDPLMRRLCERNRSSIEVICRRPDPSTTRGEAIFTKELIAERHWSTLIVVTWRYHLARADYVFSHCLEPSVPTLVMHAVPRRYDNSVPDWAMVYLYQYGGFLKAVAQGSCANTE